MDDILKTVLETEEHIDSNDICFAFTRELKRMWNNVSGMMSEHYEGTVHSSFL
jgi:hypothetical protein